METWAGLKVCENMGGTLQYAKIWAGLYSMWKHKRDFTVFENIGGTIQYVETLAGLYSR